MPRARAPDAARSDAPAPAGLSRGRWLAIQTLFALLLVDVLLESFLWPGHLWGANAYGFLPRAALLALALPLLAFTPLPVRVLDALDHALPPRLPRVLPWLFAAAMAGMFWLTRERHLLWGDGQVLAIELSHGLRFHPDEPLTVYAHHLLWAAGNGHWRPETAVAFGSVLAGFAYCVWLAIWARRRFPDRMIAALVVATLVTQGKLELFHGHVENYSYLMVAKLVFFTLGLDTLTGRRDLVWPLLAAEVAFALHGLGALLVLPAAVLVGAVMTQRGRRIEALRACAIAVAMLAFATFLTRGVYAGSSPFAAFLAGVMRVLTNPTDIQGASQFSWRHLANIWGEWMLVGPISVVVVAALARILPNRLRLGHHQGLLLLAGVIAYQVPFLITGEGNLGAARNWDLFAAPALVPALWAAVAVAEGVTAATAKRILVLMASVSLFVSAAIVALESSLPRTMSRIAALPLPRGNGPMMLGTDALNHGDLPGAEKWFRRALAIDAANPNSQSGLGLVLAREGHYDSAVEPMETATRLKPAQLSYRYDVIALELERHDWAAAIPHLEAAARLEPDTRRTWNSLAYCWLELGRPDRAVPVFERALRRFPDDPDFVGGLAGAFVASLERAAALHDTRAVSNILDRFAAELPDDPAVPLWRARLARMDPAARP